MSGGTLQADDNYDDYQTRLVSHACGLMMSCKQQKILSVPDIGCRLHYQRILKI